MAHWTDKHVKPGSGMTLDEFERWCDAERARADGAISDVEYVEALGRIASAGALRRVNAERVECPRCGGTATWSDAHGAHVCPHCGAVAV